MQTRWGDLRILNYRAIADALIALDKPGLYFVQGWNQDAPGCLSNGAGKSTVFEALKWCLFGEVHRSGAKVASIRGPAGKTTEVQVSFARRSEVTITRNRTGSTTSVMILVNGVDVTPTAPSEVDKMIAKLLGADTEAFEATSFFSGTFRFGDLKDKESKQLMERLLNLESIERSLQAVRVDKGRKTDEVEAAKSLLGLAEVRLQTLLSEKGSQEDERRVTLDAALWRLEEAEKERDKVLEEASRVPKIDQPAAPERLPSPMEVAEPLPVFQRTPSSVMDPVSPEAIAELGKIVGQLQRYGMELVGNLRVHDQTEKDWQAKIDRLTNMTDKVCPTCEQSIPHTHTAAAIVAAEALRDEALVRKTETEAKSREIGGKLVEAKELRSTLEADYAAELLEARNAREKEEADTRARWAEDCRAVQGRNAKSHAEWEARHRARETEYNRQLAEYQAAMEVYRKAETFQRWVEQRMACVAEAQANLARVEKAVQDGCERAEAKIHQQTALVADMKLTVEHLSTELLYFEELDSVFGLKGLRSAILDEAMPQINDELATLLNGISDGAIRVLIQATGTKADGTPNAKVDLEVQVAGGGSSYADCSKGERARIDIPIMLALRQVAMTRRGADTGILILDEVLDDLDAAGVERMLPVLQRVAQDCLVFVVSHRSEVSSFGIPFRVTKRGGVSTVEVGEA